MEDQILRRISVGSDGKSVKVSFDGGVIGVAGSDLVGFAEALVQRKSSVR